MCYLVATKFGEEGCVALQMQHGQHLVDFKKKLITKFGYHTLQLVTISRPEAYGEYSPYQFVSNEEEFERSVSNMMR